MRTKILVPLLFLFLIALIAGLCACTVKNSDDLTLRLDYDCYYISKTDDTNTNLKIPSSYQGKPIVGIDDGAFQNCTKLESITIPISIENIGKNAFQGCTSLKEINIAFTTKLLIGGEAFRGCTSLVTLNIDKNCSGLEIGDGAFRDCTALKSITIPQQVERIGREAFGGCSNLVSISLPFIGATSSDSDKDDVLGYIFGETSYEGGRATRQCYDENEYTDFYIPQSLKSVAVTGLKSNIPYGAFSNCKDIEEISLSKTTSRIGIEAFYGATKIKKAIIPSFAIEKLNKGNLEEVRIIGGSKIPQKAFYDCASLKTVYISDVEEIETAAFSFCLGLEKVTIAEGVSIIGDEAFCGDLNTTDISLGSDITQIGTNAFSGCGMGSIVIHKKVKTIGALAFSYCPNLNSISIGSGVTEIGEGAFEECSALTYAEFKNPDVWYYTTNPSATSGTEIPSEKLQNSTIAAKYLKVNYCDKYWKRG